ncbi:MAG: M67 family metallopeptidase [Acidimicrobiales bacterium]
MLTLNLAQREAVLATCIRALPNEGCGLLLGTTDGVVREVAASENVADSARIYEIDPKVMLTATRRADDEGLEIIGVFHSHTHSAAYPSPTDVRQAPDPSWHYVLVSLVDTTPEVMSYRILDEQVQAEELVLTSS